MSDISIKTYAQKIVDNGYLGDIDYPIELSVQLTNNTNKIINIEVVSIAIIQRNLFIFESERDVIVKDKHTYEFHPNSNYTITFDLTKIEFDYGMKQKFIVKLITDKNEMFKSQELCTAFLRKSINDVLSR